MKAVVKKTMKLRKILLHCAAVTCIVGLSACSSDDSSSDDAAGDAGAGAGAGAGGGAGGGTPPPATGLLPLTAANFEGEVKFVGPRVHAIVGEVYRNLFYIHQSVDINQRFIDASSVPRDDIIQDADGLITLLPNDVNSGIEFCTNSAGLNTVFQDNGAVGFSAGDLILRDYDNFACSYDFVDPANIDTSVFNDTSNPRLRWLPTSVTGNILFSFSGGNRAAGTYTGTATFGDPVSGLSYEVTNGLLQATESAEFDTFSGTVEFDINFETGIATFNNILVDITESSAGLPGPSTIQIAQIQRTLGVTDSVTNSVTDSVTITGGSITSTSGLALNFRTVAFNNNGADELSGPSGSLPNRGAILFEGENSAAHARTVAGGFGGIGSIGLELDYDPTAPIDPVANPTTVNQFDDSSEAEPGGSSFFVSEFLMTDAFTFTVP